MVVSFKISRIGSRYPPKPESEPEPVSVVQELEVDASADAQLPVPNNRSMATRKRSGDILSDYLEIVRRKEVVDDVEDDGNVAENSDAEAEVSFILNIFTDGYTIVNPNETNVGHHVQDDPKLLRPYDRRTESLITAIECGYLPADFLDDIPCKYINGTVICEVRDYRKESCEPAVNDSYPAALPSITRVSLKMSLNNVAKDIHLIADDTWGYGDVLEAEARILLALQPKLYLDPTPNLDMLCKEPTSVKLNLDIRGKRLKRLRQESAPKPSASSVTDSKQVMDQPDFVNLVDEDVGPSDTVATGPENHAPEDSNLISARESREVTSDAELVDLIERICGQSNVVATGPKIRAPETLNSSVRDSRQATGDLAYLFENNAGPSNMDMVATGPKIHAPESSNSSVRDWRQVTGQPDFINLVDKNVGQRNMVSTEPKIYAPVVLKRITGQPDFVNLVDQNVGQGKMIATGPQNHAPHTTFSLVTNQPSHQTGVGNLLNMQGLANDMNNKKGKNWQLPPMVNSNKRGRSTHLGGGGTNTNARKPHSNDSQVQQPLSVQFTRANFHKAPWNNMSPKREDDTVGKGSSSGSGGLQFGEGVTSVPLVSETRSLTFSANESMQQANWISNTLLKAPVISELGSSSSVGDILDPFSDIDDGSMLDRFHKIIMFTARFKLNCEKNKINDERKPTITFPKEQLEHVLFNDFYLNDHNNDIFEDETCNMPLSMSLMGGNINICKTRVLHFVKDELLLLTENEFLEIPELQTRLTLSERQTDGTVAMHLGELDDVDYLADDLLLPTLPNTHTADLLAAQFCSLMLHDGYKLEGDYLEPKPDIMVQSKGSQPEDFNGWLQQVLNSEPRESFYGVGEGPISGASLHNIHLQNMSLHSIGLYPWGLPPHTVDKKWESNSHLQNQLLLPQEPSQIQRKTTVGPDHMTGHSIGGYGNRSVVVALEAPRQRKARSEADGSRPDRMMGRRTGGYFNHSTVLALAAPKGMGRSEAYRSSRRVGRPSNFGGLQVATRQTNLESSGVGSSSGSGLGMGQNEANEPSRQVGKSKTFGGLQGAIQTHMGSSSGSWSGMGQHEANGPGKHVGQNSNFGANRQIHLGSSSGSGWGLGQSEANGPGRHIVGQNSTFGGLQLQGAIRQTLLGSSSGLWSGMGQNEANGPSGHVGQNSNFGGLQGASTQTLLGSTAMGSGSGSGSGGVFRLGSGTVDRATDMNPMQRNRYMNQQQFPLQRQEPTRHLWPVRFPSQQARSPLPPRAPSSGRVHKWLGPRRPTR